MSLVKWTFIGLLALPLAEVVTFLLVAVLIGWFWAAGLFVATSVAGVLLLRRSGRSDLDRFRAAFAQDGFRAVHLESPGVAAMLGGILLVFPGFITDLVGAALLVPPLRRWLGGKLAQARRDRRQRGRDDHVIDLAPSEWQQIPDQRRDRPRKRAARAGSKTSSKGASDDA
jgi:UPF0716 protein FxsA